MNTLNIGAFTSSLFHPSLFKADYPSMQAAIICLLESHQSWPPYSSGEFSICILFICCAVSHHCCDDHYRCVFLPTRRSSWRFLVIRASGDKSPKKGPNTESMSIIVMIMLLTINSRRENMGLRWELCVADEPAKTKCSCEGVEERSNYLSLFHWRKAKKERVHCWVLPNSMIRKGDEAWIRRWRASGTTRNLCAVEPEMLENRSWNNIARNNTHWWKWKLLIIKLSLVIPLANDADQYWLLRSDSIRNEEIFIM